MGDAKPLLFVAEVADNMQGGAARHFRFIGEELRSRGHKVDYVFLDQMPKPLFDRLQGFTLDISRRALQGVLKYIRTNREPSLIYWSVNSAFPFSDVRHFLKVASAAPLVGMTFGVEERWWPQVRNDARLWGAPPIPLYQHLTNGWLRMKVLKRATMGCDHIVCVSSQDRDYLLESYRMAPDSVSMIPVGVAPVFLTAKQAARTNKKLLFVGTWIWRKGVRFLVDAFTRVWRTNPTSTISIVGTFQKPETILADWPQEVRPNVRVVPQASGEALVQEYATHDIFVLPSLFEGMPLSLAEAMATGMAVVTTSTCGMLDLVKDRHNGLLVPPRDADALAVAILDLLTNPGLQRGLGERARATIREQTWSHVADQFLRVFQHCESTHRRAGRTKR
jgi:glycosyltransferase involved in cell wall biosynthesis